MAMRITALKLGLAVVSIAAVIVLGAGRAAAPPPPPLCPDLLFHLRTSGGSLVLDTTAPGVGTSRFQDSPVLSRAGGNIYQPIGEWESDEISAQPGCALESLSPLHAWLGLRNSDDQGTNFDLRAEVYFKSSNPGSQPVLIAVANQPCIKGLTRNPTRAQEVLPPLTLVTLPDGDGQFLLKLFARIGTPQSTCGGHASATGLRLYFDSASRDSRFDMFFFEASCN